MAEEASPLERFEGRDFDQAGNLTQLALAVWRREEVRGTNTGTISAEQVDRIFRNSWQQVHNLLSQDHIGNMPKFREAIQAAARQLPSVDGDGVNDLRTAFIELMEQHFNMRNNYGGFDNGRRNSGKKTKTKYRGWQPVNTTTGPNAEHHNF